MRRINKVKRMAILFLLLCIIATTNAQIYQEKKNSEILKKFYFGVGIDYGFYNPKELNDFVDARYSNNGGHVYFLRYDGLHLNFTAFPSKYTELIIETQLIASAPENLGEDHSVYLIRLTPALKFDYHIPIGQKTNYFVGCGINYSKIYLEADDDKNKCGALGGSFETGVFIRIKRLALRPGLAFNLIRGATPSSFPSELSYIGGNAFFTFQF